MRVRCEMQYKTGRQVSTSRYYLQKKDLIVNYEELKQRILMFFLFKRIEIYSYMNSIEA